MKSSELADQVARVVEDAQSRILGVGAEQYSEGDQQKFERMPLDDLVEYLEEETLDLVNYGVMLTLRVRQLRAAIAVAERRADEDEPWVSDGDPRTPFVKNLESEFWGTPDGGEGPWE